MIPPAMPEPNSEDPRDTAQSHLAHGNWRHELRTAVRSSGELCRVLGLAQHKIARAADDTTEFPVLVPHGFVERMRHGDPNDPLLRQVFAHRAENDAAPGYSSDPLLESTFASTGVLRKYAGRALLVTTAACPVHCRYCFRRHFPYSDQLAARDRWSNALQCLRESPEVEEVILSGGDPLSLATARLAELIRALEAIDTVTTLRIHTRFPIILPSRITASLQQLLRETRLQTVVVVHCNHANELDSPAVAAALQHLHACVDALLNQSVLLRGVNDSSRALCELSKALFRSQVLPYYLHLLDRVSGSAHFEVSTIQAHALMEKLRSSLPGYLVPRLVREEPGALSKTPVL